MKKILFRKLYTKITEKDYGVSYQSIVCYEKLPWERYTKVLSPEERKEKGYEVEVINTKYKHYLVIDLWIFIIKFTWIK